MEEWGGVAAAQPQPSSCHHDDQLQLHALLVCLILNTRVLPVPCLVSLPPSVIDSLKLHFRSLSPPPVCPRCFAANSTRFHCFNNASQPTSLLQPAFDCKACHRSFIFQGTLRPAPRSCPNRRRQPAAPPHSSTHHGDHASRSKRNRVQQYTNNQADRPSIPDLHLRDLEMFLLEEGDRSTDQQGGELHQHAALADVLHSYIQVDDQAVATSVRNRKRTAPDLQYQPDPGLHDHQGHDLEMFLLEEGDQSSLTDQGVQHQQYALALADLPQSCIMIQADDQAVAAISRQTAPVHPAQHDDHQLLRDLETFLLEEEEGDQPPNQGENQHGGLDLQPQFCIPPAMLPCLLDAPDFEWNHLMPPLGLPEQVRGLDDESLAPLQSIDEDQVAMLQCLLDAAPESSPKASGAGFCMQSDGGQEFDVWYQISQRM